MPCPCPARLSHLLNDKLESLYGDGGHQDWLGITWVCVWGGDRLFLARVNGDSLVDMKGELPSFSLNAFKSLSAPVSHTRRTRSSLSCKSFLFLSPFHKLIPGSKGGSWRRERKGPESG